MMAAPGPLQRLVAIPGAPAAALLAGLVFLFQPAQAYQANTPYFTFGLLHMGLLLLPAFALAFAVMAGVASLGGQRLRMAAAVILAALALAAWGGSTFLTGPKGMIEGRMVIKLTEAEQWRLNAGYVAFAAIGAVAMALRPAVMRRLFFALFAVLTAHAAWVVAADSKPWPRPNAGERFMALSSERNVLVVILDTFQADFLAEILRTDPGAGRSLEGFTYFPNAVGHSPTTYLSMPTIHSGSQFDPSEGMQQTYETQVVEGSFVAKLSGAGYDAMVINPVMGKCPRGADCLAQEVLLHGRTQALVDASYFLMELGAFRVAPALLKAGILRSERRGRLLNIGSDQLLAKMPSLVAPGAGKPTVRFVHLFNTHPPVSFDAQCNAVSDAAWVRGAAIDQARCAVRRVSAFLDALKARGIYDQTAVIFAADHGAGISGEQGAAVEWSGVDWGAAASPLLLVKPFGVRGELVVSPRVVGLSDIAATACAWTKACESKLGADVLGPAKPPAYPFAAYRWQHRFWQEDKVPVEDRFEIRGPPLEAGSWWRLTNLPAARVAGLGFGAGDAALHYGIGWAAPEAGSVGGRWAMGAASDVYLQLDPSRDATLELQVSTHPRNAGQSISIEVNGTAVAEVDVAPAASRAVVTVPARVIAAGPNRILFRFKHWNAPEGGDNRKLAVLFSGLAIR